MRTRPFLLVDIALVAVMLLISVWAWPQLPSGSTIDKTIELFVVPAIGLLVLLIVLVVPTIEPRRANLEQSRTAFNAVMLAALALLLVIHAIVIAYTLNKSVDVLPPVMIAVGVLFLIMGYYLPRVRSNFMFGVRTPWTLSSEYSWARTHRVAGPLLVILGVVMIASAFVLSDTWLLVVLVGGTLGIAAALVAFSYFAWKQDPARDTGT